MYLGIDLGTSEIKLLLLDRQHRIQAITGSPLTLQRPQPLWSEQHPADWWAALERAMLQLAAKHAAELGQVKGIGLSGQMHGAVALDAHDEVLRPAILWNDGRSAAACATLQARWPELQSITGNLAMPGFTAPKLVWMQEHEPALFARVKKVLLPKDWLRLQLGGEAVSEMSDAAGTLWLDVRARRWSAAALAACGLDESAMPRLVEGSAAAGTLKAELAARWGLPSGVLIAGGAGDNAASAVGMGAVHPNEGFVSLGTSGVIFLATADYRPNPEKAVHTFCHALPGRWHQMSVMLSAASCLSWAKQLLGQANEAVMLEGVGRLTAQQRARAPIFLPYLSGERTPHNNADAKGVFFGLGHEHDAAAVAYAVIEGVGFGLLDGWLAMAPARGAVKTLSLVGGGARSARWAQLLASTLGVSLSTAEGGEAGGALGGARLAWLACGGTVDDVCRAPKTASIAHPDPDEAALLAPRHARFQRLYRQLEAEFSVA